MKTDFIMQKTQTAALNECLRLSGIQIEIFRNDEYSDWQAEIDTKEHDKLVRAEFVEEFHKTKTEVLDWLLKRQAEGYGTTLGELLEYIYEYKLKEQNSIIKDLAPKGSNDMPKEIVCNCTKEQK